MSLKGPWCSSTRSESREAPVTVLIQVLGKSPFPTENKLPQLYPASMWVIVNHQQENNILPRQDHELF